MRGRNSTRQFQREGLGWAFFGPSDSQQTPRIRPHAVPQGSGPGPCLQPFYAVKALGGAGERGEGGRSVKKWIYSGSSRASETQREDNRIHRRLAGLLLATPRHAWQTPPRRPRPRRPYTVLLIEVVTRPSPRTSPSASIPSPVLQRVKILKRSTGAGLGATRARSA